MAARWGRIAQETRNREAGVFDVLREWAYKRAIRCKG